jgi:Fic-DOC domain mobile mystery protein B
MRFEYAVGATPLDLDEAAGLIPNHITTQVALNAWEQANIYQAAQWATRQKKNELLCETFVRDLHHRMFDQTWRWAGTFRSTNKNIGVDWTQVAVKLRNLLDNTKYQIEYQVYDVDEIAVRLHHQLVWIHPFSNGNGRHARLFADLFVMRFNRPRFTWGGVNASLADMDAVRKQYIQALRLADQGDIQGLMVFARS